MHWNHLDIIFGRKTKQRTSLINHVYKDTDIPLRIYIEKRKNLRIAFNQQNVILRIPNGISKPGFDKHLSWAKRWIDQQLEKKPELLNRFQVKKYTSGQEIRVNGQDYTLQLIEEDRKSVKAQINGSSILLKVPRIAEPVELSNTISRALSKLFASLYIEEVSNRIFYFNDLYFKEDIASVRIKYNKSNWGSCSARKNINISSRLLFAPKPVQDYVFVHELAHLKELNHSKRFWEIVGNIIPDYKAKEKWLKVNSHWMDF